VVLDHVVEHLVHVTRADNDLEHAAGQEGALEVGILVEGRLVDLVHIVNDQTQAGRAVRRRVNVVCAAEVRHDVSGDSGVIHSHPGVLSL